MRGQNVGTPRFYVCTLQWLKSLGALTASSSQWKQGNLMDLIGINPSSQKTLIIAEGNNDIGWNDTIKYSTDLAPYDALMSNDKNFHMALGHNFGQSNAEIYTQLGESPYNAVASAGLINSKYDEGSVLGGFSISIGNDNDDMVSSDDKGRLVFRIDWQDATNTDYTAYLSDVKIGSLLYGNYYDMPHSPDLNLKLTYEYDGVKNVQTKGGATLSNTSYTKPADWGNGMGAWQLGGVSNLRNGRRVWDLSFSYLSSDDIMPVVAATTNLESDNDDSGSTNPDLSQNTLLDGSANDGKGDFFSQVWNKTMGGHLPFIFNPNGGGTSPHNSPDQFAIARFDQSSLQYDQVANNVYNVKLKIRECW